MELAEVIGYLATALITGSGIFFGDKYKQLKKLLKVILDAAEDDKITAEEVQEIVKTGKKLLG